MVTYLRPKNDSVLVRIIKKLALFIILFVVPAVLLWYGFIIRQVEITGAEHYDADQIKKLVFNTKLDSNSLYLYMKYNYFAQPQFPFIEKIDVKLIKPGSVKLNVYEKKVAGCVEMMGEYFYFDKDGIVVESSADKLDNVPLIKGLKFNEIILNEKISIKKDSFTPYEELDISNTEDKTEGDSSGGDENKQDSSEKNKDRIMDEYIFNTIIKLTQLIDKNNIDVDAVIFGSDYDVTLECGSVTVLLGEKSTYDEDLSELGNIMKKVKGMEITIDMNNRLKDSEGIIAKPKK